MKLSTVKDIQKRMGKMATTKNGIHKSNNKKIADFIKYLRSIEYSYETILNTLSPLSEEQMSDICRDYLLLKY